MMQYNYEVYDSLVFFPDHFCLLRGALWVHELKQKWTETAPQWRITSKCLHRLTRLINPVIFMSVIFLTCLECYFWASVWLADTEHHRGEEAFQEINTCGANLRGAAVSWHLMIYGKNKTISPEFWKPFFFFFGTGGGNSFSVWNT